jgi:hypothetical protein
MVEVQELKRYRAHAMATLSSPWYVTGFGHNSLYQTIFYYFTNKW